jgi:peptide deformylase
VGDDHARTLEHEHEHDHAHEPDAETLAQLEVEARKRIALVQIRQYGDPVLRMTAREVTDFDDDLRRLVTRLTDLMHDAQGVGLAATQVGVVRRVFVFEPDDEGPRALVNPRLTVDGEERDLDEEGCLSLQGVRVPVERPTAVTLEARTPDGGEVVYRLEGYAARVAQHELDHLDGVLIVDRTDDEHRKEALSTLRPRVALR